MPVTTDRTGPYAPPSAILEVINRRRDRGLAAPINAEVLGRAGISESLIPRTLQSLTTLDLIDESGNPTPTFEGLRLAPSADLQTKMQEWLKGTYADVLQFVDPTEDDEVKFTDAFRPYNPAGQQRRMVILFRELCAAAGLAPPKSSDSQKASPARSPLPIRPLIKRPLVKPPVKPSSPARPSSGLPPALAGLMDSLPDAQTGWTSAARSKFLTTFQAVLDFCIPVVEKTESDDDEAAA